MFIEKIVGLVIPPLKPVEVPAKPDWRSIESKRGITLPQDYKWFVEVYGSGLFASFIVVANPFSKSEYLNLIRAGEATADVFRRIREMEGADAVPWSLFPEEGGLLWWANDTNGNFYFWETVGAPDEWSVVHVDGRDLRWQRYSMGMTEFLLKAITRQIKVKFWPTDMPPRKGELVFDPFSRR